MIKKMVLKNFLSYGDSEVDFSGSTIAVIGDNGVGKSAFLEAIPYAYYGIGRENKAGMSRINGDGSHSVTIYDDKGISITRGRKSTGAGITEVRNGSGEILSKGGDADAWVSDYLGMDADTFMLTAFFGLGDTYTDKLLHVLPAARLEALQELAKVGPYREFLAKAKAKFSQFESAYNSEKSRKEGAESAIVDGELLSVKLSECLKSIEESDATLNKLRKSRASLQEEEEVYQALVMERERLSVERRDLGRKLDKDSTGIEDCHRSINSETGFLRETVNQCHAISEGVPSVNVEETVKRIESLKNEIAVKRTTAKLKGVASTLPAGGTAVCPLCEQSVTSDIIGSWSVAVGILNEQIASINTEVSEMVASIDAVDKANRAIKKLNDEIEDTKESIEESKNMLQELQHNQTVDSSELEKKDNRFVFLTEKLGGDYQSLQKKISDVLSEIDACNAVKNKAEGEASQLRESISRLEKAERVIKLADKSMVEAKKNMEATNLLKDAWSRYGIPLQLVNQLTGRLESKATSVFQGFDNGRIDVRSLDDRGKPGIQFFLVDRKGERTFSQLSMGEKIMFFIAIRVAVAQIIAEDSDIAVDFLVLDEAMGNLSPKRRDDLVCLINKSLRKIFPQLILVSHTPMPEIFDKTFKITMDNDLSMVQVI